MNNELPENIGLGWLLLVLAMPFITGFHVAMGAPWMLTAVLVEVVCVAILGVSVKSTDPSPEAPDLTPREKPGSPTPLAESEDLARQS